ncbi:MAG: hypothetical protein Fur0044_54980 [Anaerolineae bacterium]|nr:hypothetical protein [Anaerolineales bacterium]MCQ3972616.1 hypothetical protein [Anaerolineae bacterium]
MFTKLFFSCFLLIGLLGCRDERAWTSADSWYNPPPSEIYPLSGWQTLDYTQVYQVTAAQQPAAEALLENAAILELTPQQAAELIGRPLGDHPTAKPYLARGVYLNQGGFSVYVKDRQILVSHSSLGHGPVPMKRQALVLQLNQFPQEVFVTCSMAE